MKNRCVTGSSLDSRRLGTRDWRESHHCDLHLPENKVGPATALTAPDPWPTPQEGVDMHTVEDQYELSDLEERLAVAFRLLTDALNGEHDLIDSVVVANRYVEQAYDIVRGMH